MPRGISGFPRRLLHNGHFRDAAPGSSGLVVVASISGPNWTGSFCVAGIRRQHSQPPDSHSGSDEFTATGTNDRRYEPAAGEGNIGRIPVAAPLKWAPATDGGLQDEGSARYCTPQLARDWRVMSCVRAWRN